MEDEKVQGYHGGVRDDAFPLIPMKTITGVLDVGGGFGNTAAAAKTRLGATKVGVVDQVASLERCNPDLDFAVSGDLNDRATIRSVGETHGPFSVILCLDVLEHLIDPWDCVNTLEDYLAPDGVLIASLPNVAHLSVSVKLFLLAQWRLYDKGIQDRTHLRFFTRETAYELLETGGLEVDYCSSKISENIYFKYLNWLRHVGFSRHFSFGYLLRARRRESGV